MGLPSRSRPWCRCSCGPWSGDGTIASASRAVVLPGTVVLAASVLALLLVEAPAAVIALMLGMGLGNGLISTSAGVLACAGHRAEHRGEALSIYYVATASALAIGPPLGFALDAAGGDAGEPARRGRARLHRRPLAWSLRERAADPVPGARLGFTLVSRHAHADRRDHDLDHYRRTAPSTPSCRSTPSPAAWAVASDGSTRCTRRGSSRAASCFAARRTGSGGSASWPRPSGDRPRVCGPRRAPERPVRSPSPRSCSAAAPSPALSDDGGAARRPHP